MLKLRFNNLLMTTANDGDTPTVERTGDGAIRINTDINPRLILLPAVGATIGLAVGNANIFAESYRYSPYVRIHSRVSGSRVTVSCRECS
jgi:hypothetical protein